MYAILDNPQPLPASLSHEAIGPARRHRIDPRIDLTSLDLADFNRWLVRLDPHQAPLTPDQLVTAARELASAGNDAAEPACIEQRLQRAAMIEHMVEDRQWLLAASARPTAVALVEYLHRAPPVFASRAQIAHLDQAIAVERAWPSLSREVRQYLQFCQREDRAAAHASAKRPWVPPGAYLPARIDCFRVH